MQKFISFGVTLYRAAVEIDSCDAVKSSVSVDVSIAQIVTAITTAFYAAVFAIGYYMMIKGGVYLGTSGGLGTGRWGSRQPHSASERSLWYALLMLGILPSECLRTPFQTVSRRSS